MLRNNYSLGLPDYSLGELEEERILWTGRFM